MKLKQFNNLIHFLELSGYKIGVYERNLLAEVIEVLELQSSKVVKYENKK